MYVKIPSAIFSFSSFFLYENIKIRRVRVHAHIHKLEYNMQYIKLVSYDHHFYTDIIRAAYFWRKTKRVVK